MKRSMNSNGTVIVDDKSSGKRPPAGLVPLLKKVASEYGNLRLVYQYDNSWSMHAPHRYLWRHNCHSPRSVSSVTGARHIVKAGLVYKATVTKWKKRFAALHDLPRRVSKLRGKNILTTHGGIYPNGRVGFMTPYGFVWKATGNDGYWDKGYRVEEEDKALKLLRGGLANEKSM